MELCGPASLERIRRTASRILAGSQSGHITYLNSWNENPARACKPITGAAARLCIPKTGAAPLVMTGASAALRRGV